MTMATITEIFEENLAAYLKADKIEKGRILTAVCIITGVWRKSAIRRFKVLGETFPEARKRSGRPRLYGKASEAALNNIWDVMGRISAERLHPQITEIISILERDKMWAHDSETTALLLRMSLGTMKDKIEVFPHILHGKGLSSTKPSSIKELIPIRHGPWENPPPGKGEIDTVAHCGYTLLGDYCYTVQYTGVAVLWTLLEAQWQKGQAATVTSLEQMRKRLPFLLLGMDPDSGSEFINWHAKRWADSKNIELTRIRPGKKNDHGRIEQKNYANVRRVIGYKRFDDPRHLTVLRELYPILEDYINFFQPSMKCVKKERQANSKRTKRTYDIAKTAYQRVLAHPDITNDAKEKLRQKYATLNPKILRDKIDKLVEKLYKIPTRLR